MSIDISPTQTFHPNAGEVFCEGCVVKIRPPSKPLQVKGEEIAQDLKGKVYTLCPSCRFRLHELANPAIQVLNQFEKDKKRLKKEIEALKNPLKLKPQPQKKSEKGKVVFKELFEVLEKRFTKVFKQLKGYIKNGKFYEEEPN